MKVNEKIRGDKLMKMEDIQEILPDIYRIPVPLTGNPLKELNSYVIRGRGGRNLLIDTGFRREDCREAVLSGLKLLGVRMEDTDILLTHLHADHSGNAAELLCEGRKAYIGEIDQIQMEKHEQAANSRNNHWMKRERFSRHGVRPDVLKEMFDNAPSRTMAGKEGVIRYTPLKEGQELAAGDYVLKAIHTPGHTPGQMCFAIEGTGAMVLGDHVLFDITPNITDWEGVEDSLGDYLASLDKIDRYEVTIPLPGHRGPGNFHERIGALKAHHAARLDECYGIVANMDHAQLYEITASMKWRIRAASWEAFPAGQKWFALGECLAHLDHLVLTGRLLRHEEDVIWYEAVKGRECQ